MKIQNGYSEIVGDNLTLRVANNELEDFQRFVSFNLAVHQDESLKRYVNRLYLEHSRKKAIYWIYIEENDSKEIVSMITLMPLEWDFNGMTIPLCEMGLVGTLPAYRNRELIGTLNKSYEAIMKQEGYFLSVIRGIPTPHVFPLSHKTFLFLANKKKKTAIHLFQQVHRQDCPTPSRSHRSF